MIIFNLIGDRGISGIEEATINYDAGTYTGQVVDGVPHGLGTMTYLDGRVIEGEFLHGTIQGKAKLTYPDGAVLEGEWENGMLIEGTYSFEGYKYVGEFKDGQRHGQGRGAYADGRLYVGEWKDGLPNGQGKGTFPKCKYKTL